MMPNPMPLVALAMALGSTADDPAPRRAAPVNVTVEASLPYIPTSNTILTRLTLPLRLTPANVGSVSEPVLREQRALVLGDALENISGVNSQTTSDIVDYVTIRGFDSLTSVLFLIDGVPEPEVAFYHMYNVESVEVLKGPGGFLYGSNAMAGAVNIVRRQPVPGTFARVGAAGGSFGTYEGTVDYNTSVRDGDVAFRLGSVWRQSEFYRDDMDNRNFAVNPAFTWRFGSASSINVNFEFVDTDYEPDTGLPLVDGNTRIAEVPRTRSYQSPFDFSDQRIGRAQIDFETKLSDAWTLRNKVYYRGLDWDTNGTLFNGVFPSFTTGRPEVSRTLVLLDDSQRFVGDRLEAVLTAKTGPVQHRVLAGVEAARFGDDFTLDVASLPNIDLEDPDETASRPLAFITGQSAEGDARSVVIAPYAMDQMSFTDRYHAFLGVRWDRIDYENYEDPNNDRQDGEASPMVGFVWAPTANLSFYANHGWAFSPPSPRVTGSLEPERSFQREAGARIGVPGAKLQATVACYYMGRENIAIPDDNGFTQQAGDQRSKGIEVEIAAEPIQRLRTFVSYAYNDAELTRFTETVIVGFDPNTFAPIFGTVDRSGNAPAFAPEHIANLWMSRTFEGGLGLAGGARYVSGQFIAEDNNFEIDEYVTVNAAVSWARDDWEFRLNLKNLTNRVYETRGFGSTSVIPAPKFAAFGGVQYRF